MSIHVRDIETRENAKIIIIIIMITIINLILSKIVETLPKPASDKQNRINFATESILPQIMVMESIIL